MFIDGSGMLKACLVNHKLHGQWLELVKKNEFFKLRAKQGADARWEDKHASSKKEAMLGDAPAFAFASASASAKSNTTSKQGISVANPAPFELPNYIPQKEWDDYLEMRKRIKKPATRRAMELAIKTLDKLADEGHNPKLVLEYSIMNAYQGLFAPNGSGRNGHGKPDPNERFERNLRAAGLTHPKVDRRPG
jgi:hypothetical protein